MNAASEPLSDGHSDHATTAMSPQKYCGFACTVRLLVPLTATDACVAVVSSSDAISGSVVPSRYASAACTAATSPSCVSDCCSSADAD
eukprot:2767467-Prymnesium_polylepis.1